MTSEVEMGEKRYALDTNVILRKEIYDVLEKYKVAVPSMIIRELEHFEKYPDKYGQLAWEAREKRRILKAMDKIYFDLDDYEWREDDGLSKTYADNNLLQYCLDTNSGLITYDGLLAEKAIRYGVEVIDIDKEFESIEDGYTGYKEVYMLPDEHQDLYTNSLDVNKYELLTNQYLIIIDDITGKPIDALKWDGNNHSKVNTKNLNSRKMGRLTAKDFYQMCAMDSMRSNQVTLFSGAAGTAKTLFALSYAMNQIEEMKSDKLIVFANSLPTRDAAQLGLYKGSLNEKLMQVSIGHILASKFGDYNEVEAMMTTGELLILPLSDIRGFDSTGMNAQILITEGQNMSVDLMKLAISRVGEDSNLLIEGDWEQQLDNPNFEGKNNGMKRVSEVYRGEKYYGEVKLKNVYRSKIADKAQEM